LAGNQFDTIYHEHLSYFSVGTLQWLFQLHSMQVIDVERFAVHGGSILVLVAPESARREIGPTVTKLLALEGEAGLTDEARYRRFAVHAHEVRVSLRNLVRGLVADGKRIAGYGAPAKGVTLLNACGLGPSDLIYCSDTTTLKQGKIIPGAHIPICTPPHAKRNPPDYYLLLCWNYAEEILRKEQDYLSSGGHMIVPLPEPSIV
jgi:novobiocin biosynthesis protein NovU/D-mycarose 3-C-methyltransferase